MAIQVATTTPHGPTSDDPRRLLVISCSQRKVHATGKIPALQRYDGPGFRVIRRYLREITDSGLEIRILSAEYGLLAASDIIEDYDRKMDVERAAQLRAVCLMELRALVRDQPFAEVFLCMSRVYLGALDGIKDFCDNVVCAAPGQGPKLRSLKRWLRRNVGRQSTANSEGTCQ